MVTDDWPGLLTECEREMMAGQQSSVADQVVSRDELVERLYNQIPAVLADLELLYLCLTDEELRRVFEEHDDGQGASMRSTAQYVVALMYYGLALTGDDVEYRLASAIQQAEADRGMHASVEVDVVTEPFLPPAQRIAALKEDGFARVSFEAFDRLFYDERVSADEFAAVVSAIDEEITVEEIRKERDLMPDFERIPTPVVTSVETESSNGDR